MKAFSLMKYIKPEKKQKKITAAVCFSLLIHVALAALLVFGLSGNLISPPKLNGINLVWVSLDAKSNISGVAIQKSRLEQPSPLLERSTRKPANTETPSSKPEAAQILAATTVKELTNAVTLAKYDVSGRRAKEQNYNITGYSTDQNVSNTSNLNTVIAYPLYRENAPPAYPEIARVRGYEGIVLVSAEILPDGRVGNMKIRKSSGYAILDQSAIEAVKPWKFEPAKKSGNPFTVWVELPIKFILHNNS
jgi:TonB family C-terminal domain